MKIKIYQIGPEIDQHDLMFMNLEFALKKSNGCIKESTYELVYEGDVPAKNLEDVFYIFNNATLLVTGDVLCPSLISLKWKASAHSSVIASVLRKSSLTVPNANGGTSMSEMLPNTRKVSPRENIPFKCIGCGQCCRNVYQQVPIEPLDAFRMAKFLRNRGENITCTDDFLEKYAEAVLLDECGYFFFFLKTKGEDHACIFLENNRCKIHAANPRACRTYPFLAGFDDSGNVEYMVSYERVHHFKGPMVHPKTWMKTRFTQADQDFLKADYGAAREIAMLLRKIPENERTRAVLYFLICKYSNYDLDKPFQPQFERNQIKLLEFLQELSKQ